MHLLVLILLCCCCGILGLKCRSQDGISDEELKRTVRSCMQRSGSGNNQDDNERRQYNYDSNYNQDFRQGGGQGERDYRQGAGQGDRDRQRQGQGQQSYGNRWQRSVKHSEMNNNRSNNNSNNNNNNNNNSSEQSGCVAQCFFEEMNMVDSNGQPDRRKVSYLLTKDIRDRGLRNFYMDTVQQCFRYLEQSRYQNNNKCGQSRELIKCMSEYAKAQCDDWEEHSNLLFN